ncbi:LacI family DNA-binding transcriptional regulator [Microbacterium paraoxydans]|uniref:LacI family DNA-binding transcriptional regulator n=1 Tax=Microbacterium paraoxydans TaxID=199592 RepID=A0ABS5IIF2_9MICO|nr:LacI family DNA-binding transcriptional regulator [Microbacterium paraoxydans]MBS0022748.1 LacI family DNA-binding transcriptional regulator [Microbacterium paraoxydans]
MNERAHRPTVKEVAQRAGVSPMTVSRTLSGGVNVKPEVQQRVLAAVAELGYHRNENARSIRPGHSSGLIGVAITNIANPYYSTFALGVEEEAALTGRRILLGNTSEDAAREAELVGDFLGRRVDGLIVVPASATSTHLAHSQSQGVPVVLASRRIEGLAADSVVLADEDGAFRGTTALIDRGHTRIGYLGNALSIFTGRRRHAGFVRALEARGLPVDAHLVATNQQTVEQARDATRALLRAKNPPTAIFCANNRNAIGALKEISTQLGSGLRTPGDFPEIVSFDDFELAELSPVPISVIDHDPRELGRTAARLLLDRLDGGDRDAPSREIELPVSLRDVR